MVIKKLDKLILRSFIGPFFATFLISVFVLVMQFLWLWIDDVVGKGLDMITIGKLLLIITATTIPLALPLSLLLSSIMTFGKLGESFELVAIKAAGISLARFMRPLLIVAVLLSGIAFLFSNNIIPVANLKQTTLLTNVITTKPAVNFKPGVFYDKIPNYIIRIGYKDKSNKNIGDVVIFEKNYGLQDDIISAKSGTMEMTPDKLSMQFTLQNGYMYNEEGRPSTSNTQLTRTHFETYKKVFDMSTFKFNEMGEEAYKGNPKMLSLRQLLPRMDSLKKGDTSYPKRIRIALNPNIKSIQYQDSIWAKNKLIYKTDLTHSLSDSVRNIVYQRAVTQLESAKNNIKYIEGDYKDFNDGVNLFLIEINRKFTLSAACFILFMIGAPLGSIIRKGGLGSPLVFSIIFFVLFYLLNTIGERLAKQNVVSVFTGMWLSSFVLLPIGLFLTYKAMRDSQLFNNEAYFRFFKKIKKMIGIKVKRFTGAKN
ncbi:MAG: LptF/LptG family permease [Arachidicoccus sp.]|nr:LptF/LptG family permease [Arachidicoccus sp.]